jgi:molybdenum cofactor synthesis domain-containing protein
VSLETGTRKLKKAVILTIGNEILSGDVLDENSNWVAKRLFNLGVELSYIFVLPDDVDIICKYINEFKGSFDYVITIGGMGPTPDDVTKDAVAKAFGLKLKRNEKIVELIQKYYKGKATEEKFLMAIFPETAEPLLTSDQSWAVGLNVENVFSFPGTPFLVRDAFPGIEHMMKASPIYKSKLSINCEETKFADIMSDVGNHFPEVNIGSYPSNEDFRKVKLIFKSRDKAKIEQCKEFFVNSLRERFSELEIS